MQNNMEDDKEEGAVGFLLLSKFRRGLEFISLGKYSMKMYDEDGTGYFSSWIGGIITLLAVLLVSFMAISIALNTIH